MGHIRAYPPPLTFDLALLHLRHTRVQVVHEHVHDGRCMPAAHRILAEWVCLHRDSWPKAVHVDVTIIAQLLCELRGQSVMQARRKVTQSIAQAQLQGMQGAAILWHVTSHIALTTTTTLKCTWTTQKGIFSAELRKTRSTFFSSEESTGVLTGA